MEVGVADCHRQEVPHPVWGHACLSHSEVGVPSVNFEQAVTMRLTRSIPALTVPPHCCPVGRGTWHIRLVFNWNEILTLKRWGSLSCGASVGIWLQEGFRALTCHHFRWQKSFLVETVACHLPYPIVLFIWNSWGYFYLSLWVGKRPFTCGSSFLKDEIYESGL